MKYRTSELRGSIFSTLVFLVATATWLSFDALVPWAAWGSDDGPGLTAIELTLVDDEATGYATFQSHNQKVVSNRNGILVTHI